ncbi:MAG: hypothetical protein GWP70_09140 [Proteobacteria bacterium]|nr:hypothetical protein [Pseudomonadota bacterium]
MTVVVPFASQTTSTLSVELPALGRQPLIGVPLRCWVSAWCVGLAQPGGEVGWVFRGEVSASAYAALRRRVLHGV